MAKNAVEFKEYYTKKLRKNSSLAEFEELAKELGIAKPPLRVIHIAGTNGKGSTATFISSILSEAGYSVGLFTSPSLHTINERIRIDGVQISDVTLRRYASKIAAAEARTHVVSGFARLTAAAMLGFIDNEVDFAILETGLGGRLDPTNAFESEAAIITSVGFDHMHVLGNTIEQIATEKSGIIKGNTSFAIVHPQDSSAALSIIKVRCVEKNVEGFFLDDYSIIPIESDDFGQEFSLFLPKTESTLFFHTNLLGGFQQMNAASAALCALRLGIDAVMIYKGILAAKNPGRFEILIGEDGCEVVLDGAHNFDAFVELNEALNSNFGTRARVLLVSIAKDKEVYKIASAFTSEVLDLAFTIKMNDRSADPEDLAMVFREKDIPAQAALSMKDAFDEAMSFASAMEEKNPIIIAAGSFVLVGELRTMLINEKGYIPLERMLSNE